MSLEASCPLLLLVRVRIELASNRYMFCISLQHAICWGKSQRNRSRHATLAKHGCSFNAMTRSSHGVILADVRV